MIPLASPALASHAECELDLAPETDRNILNLSTLLGQYPDFHTITATLTDRAGGGTCAAETRTVDFELSTGDASTYTSGTNALTIDTADTPTTPDATCTITTVPGNCTVEYDRDTVVGTDTWMAWIDHDGDNGTATERDASETQAGAGAEAEPDSTDVITKSWVDRDSLVLDVEPESSATTAGTQHTVNATVTSPDAGGGPVSGVIVDFERFSGPNSNNVAPNDMTCTTDAAGTCSANYTGGTTAGTDVVCGWTDDGDTAYLPGNAAAAAFSGQDDGEACDEETTGTDTFAKTDLVDRINNAQVATTIDCTPDTDTNTLGSAHQFTCNVKDQAGNNMAGVEVDGEITAGPHDDDAGATSPVNHTGNTTDASGNVSYSYNPASTAGTDTICFWIDHDNDTEVDPTGPACTEPQVDNTNSDADAGTPNERDDATDVVTKTWNAPAAAARLEVTLETDGNPVNTPHVWTAHVFDSGGAHITTAGTVVHGELVGAGDPDNNDTPATPDRTCTTDNTGHCTFPSVTSATPGTTTFYAWIDTDANATVANNDASEGRVSSNTTDCVTGDGVQNDPPGACTGTATPGATAEPDSTDVVTKTFSGVAQTLSLAPENDSAAVGTCNVFTVTLLDNSGAPGPFGVGGAFIDVEQVHADHGPPDPPTAPDISFCSQAQVTAADPNAPNPSGVDTNVGDDVDEAADAGDAAGTGDTPNDGDEGGETTTATNGSGQVSFGVLSTGTGTVNIAAFCELQANICPGTNDDDAQGNEPQDTAIKSWTPGGDQGVTSLDCEPETDSNPEGTTRNPAGANVNTFHTFTCTARNSAGQGVAGVNVVFDITGTGPNADNVGVDTPCNGVTNNNGVTTCTYSDDGAGNPGTDDIIAYVNQNPPNGTGPGPQGAAGCTVGSGCEPQDAIQKTWTAPPAGLRINLTCVGEATTGDGGDVADLDEEFNFPQGDCTNPAEVASGTETFTALVTNPNGTAATADDTPVAGIQVLFRTATGNDCGSCGKAPADQTLGGTPDGPVFCVTAADGTCSVDINNPTPTDTDFFDVFAEIFGQTTDAPFGDDEDVATKVWSTRIVKSITLTPQSDTNQNNTSHTVGGTVLDQFGDPVAGANVDFAITAGRNVGLTSFDKTSTATGQVTFTYTDSGPAATTGTDTIKAWVDVLNENDTDADPDGGPDNSNVAQTEEPDASAVKNWQPTAPATASVQVDMEPGDGDSDTGDGCGNTAAPTSATAWDAAANPNNINVNNNSGASNIHPLCASAFQTNGAVNTNGDFTFTLTGPGQFTDATGTQNFGASVGPTQGIFIDQAGHAHTFIKSTTTGTTTVTATHGGQSDTGTKLWQNQPANARNVYLCHGETATATCEPTATNAPGDDHELTVKVVDIYGNPVPGVAITWSETGPGTFLSQQNTTDANGQATAILISQEEGTSSVTAAVPVTGGVDECEETANSPFTGATAGNCTATVTKEWVEDLPVFACDDDSDNDGDGFVDFDGGTQGAEPDPGCDTATDDSEAPFNEPPIPDPTVTLHPRRVSIKFAGDTGKNGRLMVVSGRLRLADDSDNFQDCIKRMPINVQRRVNGNWVTKKSTDTNGQGRYAVEITDLAGKYRAKAPRQVINDVDANHKDVCQKAVKVRRRARLGDNSARRSGV